jgi:hypothetical protein
MGLVNWSNSGWRRAGHGCFQMILQRERRRVDLDRRCSVGARQLAEEWAQVTVTE